ncbi:MAG: oligosaccharide flippase family protein [Ruminococcus sp.]|nr:oligosaccharide flippase family protein [Ruminococcus sp.]
MNKILNKYKSLSVQARASFWFLICAFLQKGISSITTPIFTRLMTNEEFGEFGVFNSWMGIISVFVTFNLFYGVYSQGLVKFSEERAIFSSSLEGLTLTLTVIYTVVYLLFHRFFNELFHLTTIQMLSMFLLMWTSAVFNLWAEEQRVEFKYKAIVAVSLVTSLITPILSIILIKLSEDKVTARIIGSVLVNAICFSVLFVIHIRHGGVFYSKKYWVYAIKYNLPLLPHYLSATVLSSADRIMIEHITGSGDAGIYNLAYSVALIMTIFNTVLMQTISPWMYQKIKDKKIKDIENIAYISLLMIGAVNILLILFAPEIISIFAPKEYYDAVWAIPPVVMSVYFMYSYNLFAKFAFYYEKTNFIMIGSIVGALLNVVLNYLMIPVFGFVAAAYTTLICYMIFAFAHYLFMRKVCRGYCDGIMPYNTKIILIITIVFLILGFTLMITYLNIFVRYAMISTVMILTILFRERIKTAIQVIIAMKKKK